MLPFICILSLVPHKELRFLLPIFPMMNMITGIGFHRFYHSTKITHRKKAIFISASFAISAIVSVLYCRGFSTAGIAITDHLNKIVGTKSVFFLFSHAAPLYAGVLRPEAKLDYVHMEPPFLKNFPHVNR